jgi:hypothetical protein
VPAAEIPDTSVASPPVCPGSNAHLQAARALPGVHAEEQEDPMQKRCALLVLAIVAPACGGGGTDKALVGRWELHDDDTGVVRSTLTFDADGSFRYEELGEGAESDQGTYETDGGVLSLDGTSDEGAHVVGDLTYFAGDDQLAFGTLLPDGAVDGPVGHWSGSIHLEEDGEVAFESEDSYRLAADGSATVESRNGDDAINVDDATWVEEGGEVVVSFDYQGIGVNVHMQLIEGAALGGPIYTRAN